MEDQTEASRTGADPIGDSKPWGVHYVPEWVNVEDLLPPEEATCLLLVVTPEGRAYKFGRISEGRWRVEDCYFPGSNIDVIGWLPMPPHYFGKQLRGMGDQPRPQRRGWFARLLAKLGR